MSKIGLLAILLLSSIVIPVLQFATVHASPDFLTEVKIKCDTKSAKASVMFNLTSNGRTIGGTTSPLKCMGKGGVQVTDIRTQVMPNDWHYKGNFTDTSAGVTSSIEGGSNKLPDHESVGVVGAGFTPSVGNPRKV